MSDTPSEDDPRNSLTDAIRTTAKHLVQSGSEAIDTVIDVLSSHNGTIFNRLALDLLREHGDAAPATVGLFLTDATLMSDQAVEREYLRLAMAGATWPQPNDEQQMIALIGRGPGDEWLRGMRLVYGTSLARAHTERWQRDRYAAIETLLPASERARLTPQRHVDVGELQREPVITHAGQLDGSVDVAIHDDAQPAHFLT